ncbi:HNH endonuclease family protein [Rhodococcus phenolicus]|uniref:HNH endonuclease family protein n=1 Tax=Rhodococcus phenolicus TaxID=263849 RepID=UPI000AA03881|nr:HNH endonuclease family protein [Rhodococcus phenolicus]
MRGGKGIWILVVAVAIVASCWWERAGPPDPAAPGSPSREELGRLLASVTVVFERPHVPGYHRGCGAGEACVFGPAWSDDHPGRGGHDGCDTRNNVLARDLREVTFRPGAGECAVQSGTLDDPYTGTRILFRRSTSRAVHIDHIFPLAAAWDLGAASWSRDLRRQFANDIDFNLIAVDGTANEDKRDHTPADWLPPAASTRCWFAGKYLTVAVRYGLPVTAADHRALTDAAATCPDASQGSARSSSSS